MAEYDPDAKYLIHPEEKKLINPQTGLPIDAGPWVFKRPITQRYLITFEETKEAMNEDEKEWLRSYSRRHPDRCGFKPEDIK